MSNLRTLRTDQDLVLETVAKQLNIDPSNLSRIERGRQFPSNDTIKELAAYYGKSEGEIYALALASSDSDKNAA
jgi:transcriptional regulator with XRE-family HTH domain